MCLVAEFNNTNLNLPGLCTIHVSCIAQLPLVEGVVYSAVVFNEAPFPIVDNNIVQ